MEEGLADYSHLPTDALCVVFQHLFEPAAAGGLPLSEFLELWTPVRRVCTHWSGVLLATPPPVHLDISTMPEAWLPWLAQLPVHTLRIQERLDARWSSSPAGAAGQQQDGGSSSGGRAGPPPGMPAPLTALQLVAGVEGSGLPKPFWSLAAFAHLRRLHLQAPVSSPAEPAVFASSALEGLQQLSSLSLGSFADFQLEQLPASLRRLRLAYDSQARTLSVPELPSQISRLDLLRLEKPGALGLCCDDVWGCVASLEVQCQELLLGVPVEDPRLVRTFERPYREGNFVPPHIWGDEEADDNSKHAADMTANHLLACLPSCTVLERMCLRGPAASSCKFMPVLPQGWAPPGQQGGGPAVRHRDALRWIWSVVRLQGLHNLLGLSGREMEARKQMYDDRLRFELAAERCCIVVARRVQAREQDEDGWSDAAPAGPARC